MNMLQKKRPTAVTVIGWSFIALSGLMIFSGITGLLVFSFMQQSTGGQMPPMPKDLPGPFGVLSTIFKYFAIIAILQVLFAVFVLIAGIYFLKLRAWARIALEVVSWLALTYVVGFSIFGLVTWLSISSSFLVNAGSPAPPAVFNVLGVVMNIIVMVSFAAPLVVIIMFLRGNSIRDAVKDA